MLHPEAAPQTKFDDPAVVVGEDASVYDVVIIGGGPAGLSAALLLGRCRRTVLVIDSGSPRNACAKAMHGYLTRDGTSPADFLSLARQDLKTYATVSIRHGCVGAVSRQEGYYLCETDDGFRAVGRRLLLATGVVDEIPQIQGLGDLYGTSVHHCPICDGWEWRDRAVAVYGRGKNGFGLSVEMTAWTRDIVLLTDGPSELDPGQIAFLQELRIRLDERPLSRLEAEEGQLRRVIFREGEPLERDALFFSTGNHQRSNLAQQLGASMDEKGCVWTTDGESTDVPGLFVAGDASKNAQLVIVAAAEGALAAVAINRSLTADYRSAKGEQKP